ncbi:trace amine-associated receptor 13c-like [Trichomycterus rosablanca]|uniref:trace amine-associated receptor 13c-like n=1 Tax=Trichomycterus rosablanca TaxID=2290929 RepID=UPI002F359974
MLEAFNAAFIETEYCYPESNASCVKNSYHVGTQTVLYFLLALAMAVTILGNFVVIISIAHFKQLHTPTNILVMSLALVDLLMGLIVMPFAMIRSVNGCWYYGKSFCFVHLTFDMFLTCASIFHLICIATDRYEAVCRPLQYPTTITIAVALLMAALSWTISAVYSLSVMLSRTNDLISSSSCLGNCSFLINALWAVLSSLLAYVLPCCVMILLYAKIFFISRKHARKMEAAAQTRTNMILHKISQKVKHENKAARTLGIVVGAFNLCWMPCFLTSVVDSLFNFSTPPVVYDVFVWLGYINSTLNPIIYGLFYPWFRKTLYLIVTLKIFAPNSSNVKVYAA